MKKKMLSLALALVMCLSLIPCAFAAETVRASKFTDVPSNAWYYDELDYAVYNGFISGTTATTFNPDGSLSRAAFVTIMGRMLGAPTSGGSTKFTDVDAKSWYAPYVAWAAQNKIVNGTSSTTFSPEANITVEQMATILTNYCLNTGTMLECNTRLVEYKDDSSVSGWAVMNVEYMRQFDLLHAGNGYIHPQKAVSRAEGAYTLARFAKAARYGTEPPTSGGPTAEKPDEDDWDIQAYTAKSDAKAQAIHDELWSSGAITASSTEKDKAIAYAKWIGMNCFYGDGVAFGYPQYQSHDAYGALVNGRAVCEGLSLAYEKLLKLEGFTVESVNYKGHMYTHVTVNGVVYCIDMTHVVGQSKKPDGTFYQTGFDREMNKFFNPISVDECLRPTEW